MELKESKEECESFIRSIRTDLEEEAEDNFKLAKAIETLLNEFKKYQALENKLKEDIERWQNCMNQSNSVENRVHWQEMIDHAKELQKILKGEKDAK